VFLKVRVNPPEIADHNFAQIVAWPVLVVWILSPSLIHQVPTQTCRHIRISPVDLRLCYVCSADLGGQLHEEEHGWNEYLYRGYSQIQIQGNMVHAYSLDPVYTIHSTRQGYVF